MLHRIVKIVVLAALAVPAAAARPQPPADAGTVLFWEDGFPAADTARPTRAALVSLLPGARVVASDALDAALTAPDSLLLVLPYGSAFPRNAWPAIVNYLERGGNLLVLGGKPFTRPASRENGRWTLGPPLRAFAEKLYINDYQETPGSSGLEFQANPDTAPLEPPPFSWSRAFSATLRLTDEDLYPREGSAGGIDARLVALAWGVSAGRRLSAPLVRIDHLKNRFAGGRWIFLSCELGAEFWTSEAAQRLIPALARDTIEGAEDWHVRPSWPVFVPGEPPTFSLHWMRFHARPAPARFSLELSVGGDVVERKEVTVDAHVFPYSSQFSLSADRHTGLHVMTARLFLGRELHAVYRTGYWVRDDAALRSGLAVSLQGDYFVRDGRTELVAGTTYMASDVQRQFFFDPNPYVWDRDMAEIRAAGFNMLRTGWWTGWDQAMKESGVVREDALRSVEAFLLTAQAHDLPVQFTIFAFAPEVLGGGNPYLDPEALRRQREFVLALVNRFGGVPFLIWDLINEPSFSNPRRLWATRPNGDEYERQAWNEWLTRRYKSREELEEAWKITPLPPNELPPLPEEDEFSYRAPQRTMQGSNALKAPDYFLFAQEEFARWAQDLRDAIHASGSRQLITVGQDEGGGRDRPSPAFFVPAVDFTTTHPWWQHDALLWDSLVAKQPGKPMLVQELGVARDLEIDASERYTPQEKAALLERKLAIAAATSAGAIQWLWNTNAYMRNDNEAAIGAVRVDGTEKPEASVLRHFASFAAATRGLPSDPEPAPVAIVTSQALQYSALDWLGLDAQMRAVRALEYGCRVPAAVVAENQLERLSRPRLVILPSPLALSDEAWARLMAYVRAGGTLLLTGSAERDAHWRATGRLHALGLDASPAPLTFREAAIDLDGAHIPLTFAFDRQQFAEYLATADGRTMHELNVGSGKLYVTNYPVELSESLEPAAAVYRWVLVKVGITSAFTGKLPSSGVLIRRALFRDAAIYLFVSESANDEPITVRDTETGWTFDFSLGSRRARLELIDRKTGRLIAAFGND